MSDEKIAGIMRDLIKTLEKKDVEKALSFFAEDGVWVTPEGVSKGKEELKRYLTWFFNSIQDLTVTESGNGIIVLGNKAFYEHVLTATIKGMKTRGLAMLAPMSSVMTKSGRSGRFMTDCWWRNR